MKKCKICLVDKPEEDFPFKNKAKGKRQTVCKLCQNVLMKEHYRNNKKQYIDKNLRRKVEAKDFVNRIKSNSRCKFCGEADFACLTFHHTDPKEKEWNISNIYGRGLSEKSIMKEIDKCIVLCFNCHMKLHYSKNGVVSALATNQNTVSG